jgi:Xaa-Pro dipeptidase
MTIPDIAEPWFPREEYLARVSRVQKILRERMLDGLLAFQPESVTWLTGYFTRGYSTYQFAIIPAEGEPAIFCRDVSHFYLERTSVFGDHAHWSDGDDIDAAAASFVRRKLGACTRIAVELGAWQMNAARWQKLSRALEGHAAQDAGDLVTRLRFVKSAREIEFQRAAARAAEAGMSAARAHARAGQRERDIAAEVVAAMIRAGSDFPGPGPFSSGERALHLHGGYTDRILATGDTLQVECTPAVRHYHARFMRTLKIDHATDAERKLAAAMIAAQDTALAEVKPGVVAAIPDRIYREQILASGQVDRYTNKTFYSIGLMFPPTGGESLEVTPHSTWCFEPGMVFHTYLLVTGFGFSETIVVTTRGCERLTGYERALIVT